MMRSWKKFRGSERARRRALELVRREREGQITPAEVAELDRYLDLQATARAGKPRRRRHTASVLAAAAGE